jgi:hypothetical protein
MGTCLILDVAIVPKEWDQAQLVEIQVSDLDGVAPASSHYFLQRYASQSKQDFDHDN